MQKTRKVQRLRESLERRRGLRIRKEEKTGCQIRMVEARVGKILREMFGVRLAKAEVRMAARTGMYRHLVVDTEMLDLSVEDYSIYLSK